jgi:uncharacterized protein YdaU (DUF1376 family)
MTWAKLSDAFYDDPDTDRLSLEAIAAFCLVLSWCAKHETDGRISVPRITQLARRKTRLINELTAENHSGEAFLIRNGTGLVVRNWSKYQPTKEQMQAMREAAAKRRADTAERVRRHRDAADA